MNQKQFSSLGVDEKMKIRNGFVTNSSSSSFIISTTNTSLDGIYTFIHSAYCELEDKIKEVIEFAKSHKIIANSINDLEEAYKIICDKTYGKGRSKYGIFEHLVYNQFGISIFDIVSIKNRGGFGWKGCTTYQEYLNYFREMKEKPPFIIIDHNNDIRNNIHEVTEAIGWYTDEYVYNSSISEIKERINKLGRFGVYSESNKMPNYVFDMLDDISEYACSHMG